MRCTWFKKEWPRAKRPCWKRCEIEMAGQGLLLLIGLKILIIVNSLQNIVISSAQGLMLMRSKFLIKMTRPQNIKMKEQCFVTWSSLWSPQHQETLSTQNNKVLHWCHDYQKIFNPIKGRRPWPLILISYLFQQGLFNSWLLLFLHLECFGFLILYLYKQKVKVL